MTVTSLRLEDEIYKEIKDLAAFHGENVTTFMRRTILERLEDESDYRDAVAAKHESNGETVSRAEMLKRVGL
ncbi:MAG TPA: DUF6290 family protein [Lactobacillaceae bacterium]